jgi:uncharacterized protein (DUF58 family)
VFDPEATSTIWLIPDFDAAAHVGDGPEATEETMIILAASLADHFLRRRLAVGLLAQAGDVTVVRPQASPAHLWTVLRALAPLHLVSGLPLATALARLQGARGGTSIAGSAGNHQYRPAAALSARDRVVILTPSLDLTWVAALRGLSWRGGVSCILLDRATFDSASAPAGSAQAAVGALAEFGVSTSVLRQGDLQPAEGTYGALRRWDFVTVGTGKAVARQKPRKAGTEGSWGKGA